MLIGRRLIALDVEGSGVKGGGTASVLAIGCWVAVVGSVLEIVPVDYQS